VTKTDSPSAPSGAPAPPPEQAAAVAQKPIVQEEKANMSEPPAGLVSPPPEKLAPGHSVISREEKVEYRDQDGNLLDPEQVKSLEGKVSFKTRYETRTRMVDAQGNEIIMPDEAGVAPPHPDVEGVDRETVGAPEQEARVAPNAQRDVEADESKENNVEKSGASAAKPASEGNDATGA
jgi:dolichyl-phosphate-mannose-protein mannosyltransferase